MQDLQSELARIIRYFSPRDGVHPSPVAGVYCVKHSTTSRRAKQPWRACFGIVAQGSKEIVLGRKAYQLDNVHYSATPIVLPVISRISSATLEKPFLALLIDLDPLTLSEVTAQLEDRYPQANGSTARAFFRGKASERMLEAAVRLAKLFHTPEDTSVLGPLIIKEIFYYLLTGPEGSAIRQFVRSGSKTHKISQAIHTLTTGLNEEVDVPALARNANMSRSAFFLHFKAATAMSPIQYQKRLRLMEARRLMVDDGETAESSAFKVGYHSASQFSREYSRMFGNSPSRDAMHLKTLVNGSEGK